LKTRIAVLALIALVACRPAMAQQTPDKPEAPDKPQASDKWQITDNSFLIEEAFNQEAGVFQNIFVWTRGPHGTWQAGFTQEWPAPTMTHQFSYTIPFAGTGSAGGLNDAQLHYRYQLLAESSRRPAVSPRLSAIIPTGDDGDGLGNGTAGFQFNIPASKQFGNLYVHLNAGATWLRGDSWTPLVGSGVIWQVHPRWNLMLEAVSEPGQTLTWSPGLRHGWSVGDGQVVVGAAVPVTFDAEAPTSTAFLAYFSYETRFR